MFHTFGSPLSLPLAHFLTANMPLSLPFLNFSVLSREGCTHRRELWADSDMLCSTPLLAPSLPLSKWMLRIVSRDYGDGVDTIVKGCNTSVKLSQKYQMLNSFVRNTSVRLSQKHYQMLNSFGKNTAAAVHIPFYNI